MLSIKKVIRVRTKIGSKTNTQPVAHEKEEECRASSASFTTYITSLGLYAIDHNYADSCLPQLNTIQMCCCFTEWATIYPELADASQSTALLYYCGISWSVFTPCSGQNDDFCFFPERTVTAVCKRNNNMRKIQNNQMI